MSKPVPIKRDTQRAAQREHARRKRRSSGSVDHRSSEAVVEPLVAPELRIQHAGDVLDVLARYIRAVDNAASADALMKARVVGQLLIPELRAIEARDAADRERPLHDRQVGAQMADLLCVVLDRLDLTVPQRAAIQDAINHVLPLFTEPDGGDRS